MNRFYDEVGEVDLSCVKCHYNDATLMNLCVFPKGKKASEVNPKPPSSCPLVLGELI